MQKAVFVCLHYYHLDDQGGTPLLSSPRTPSIHWGIICQDCSRGLEVTSRQPKGIKLGFSKIANFDSSWIVKIKSKWLLTLTFVFAVYTTTTYLLLQFLISLNLLKKKQSKAKYPKVDKPNEIQLTGRKEREQTIPTRGYNLYEKKAT